jgi:hypothetical protein
MIVEKTYWSHVACVLDCGGYDAAFPVGRAWERVLCVRKKIAKRTQFEKCIKPYGSITNAKISKIRTKKRTQFAAFQCACPP